MCLACLLSAMLLTGCGVEKEKKVYTVENETYSIEMDGDWVQEDGAIDEFLCLVSQNGHRGIMVLQFPKAEGYDMDVVREKLESMLKIDYLESAEAPEQIPGMQNLEAYTGTVMEAEDLTGEEEAPCYIVYGETEYASYAFLYVTDEITPKRIRLFGEVCASFVENAPEEESPEEKEILRKEDSAGQEEPEEEIWEELPEEVSGSSTVMWFNAVSAVPACRLGLDYRKFGGFTLTKHDRDLLRELLEETWEVTDKESAEEAVEWLLSEGNQKEFAETMELFGETLEGIQDVAPDERGAWIYDNYEVDEEHAHLWASWYNLYEDQGETAIAAWDYSRAMSFLGFFYIAGYYTQEEALDESLEIAEKIQGAWDSWDAFMVSYFVGSEWSSEESSSDLQEIYNELKEEEDSLFGLEWNLEFEKNW